MKIQRKLLTGEQKQAICDKQKFGCYDCPLYAFVNNEHICWNEIKSVETEIKNFWNAEVDIDL